MTDMSQEKNTKPKQTAGKRKSGFGKLFAICGVTAAVAIVCALIGYMFIIYSGQKLYEQNKDKMEMSEASTIYDANNKEVGVLARENREIVEAKDIPQRVSNAFIATEDRRFQQHGGVDFWAIGRAIAKDIVARSAVEGGSTITQQLAKNMFLNSDKTFFRKGTEMSIALALENNKTKDEIMTMYLNRIFFGSGAYGIKAAAKVYFGKSDLNQLETWEIATLAAIPKAPSTYSPLRNPDKSKERRAVVLKLMADQGYITEEEMNKAKDVDYVPPPAGNKQDLMAYQDYIVKEAVETYHLQEDKLLRGGYKIYTTMDVNAQRTMEQAFNNPKLFQKDGPEQKMQGSMVILNNKDGGIVAMVGGRDYVNKGLNRAVVPRQPGSSFKPIVVYAPAIETGDYNPYSKLKDEERDYNGYSPRNYDGVYRGEVDMFEAVRKSINAPAVWLLSEIKLNTGMSFAKKMEIPFDPKDTNLAIALGGMTKGVTPLQMAQAYTSFANNGYMNKAHAIREIVDGDGEKTVFKPSVTKVMSPKTAYYMTELLRGVVDGGTGTAAKMNRPVAGKTGTTQLDLKGLEKNNRDVWFVGYTPEWTAAVWMGFDKTDTKHYVIPASGPLPAAMFKEVMSKSMAKMPVTSFTKPDGVSDIKEPPTAVTNLTAEYVKDNRKVKLAWTGDPGNDLGSYQVFRKDAKEQDFKKILEVKSAFEVNDLDVKPGETYQYYVVPFNIQSNQTGDKSNIAEVAIPADQAVSPTPSQSPGASPGGSGKPGESGGPSKKPGGGKATATPTPGPTASQQNGSPATQPLPSADVPVNGTADGAKPGDGGNGGAKPEPNKP